MGLATLLIENKRRKRGQANTVLLTTLDWVTFFIYI